MSDHYYNPHEASRWKKIWQGFKNLWVYYRGWKMLIFIGMSLGLLLSTYLVVIAKTTNVGTLQEGLMNQTTVYDVYDEKAGTLWAQKGTYVTLDQISPQMRETLVNTEDKRFYEHNGFDTIGIGRALISLVFNRNLAGGGGSTITQQLTKNAFLTLDQTFERKLKELFLALEVEKHYTKDEILEMYLNNSYFGNGVWGVEDATMKYFGHSASSLDWNESMVLTATLNGPSIFNPIDDYELAVERRNAIAEYLSGEGVISQDDSTNIQNSPIYLYDAYYTSEQGHEYPSYFDAVINEAVSLTSIPESDLLSKGYQIYTNLEPSAQQMLIASYEGNSWIFGDDGTGTPLVQSASVVVDPDNGGVMAVYGGRGDYVYRGFNRATDMYRAPGSTIKPLAVYVSALESGYNIHSMVEDVVKGYGSENYAPENYDLHTDPEGEVELYYALAQSKNTSAVYLMNELGINRSIQKLKQFGINITEGDQKLNLALGGLELGVTPLQLASAYATFANEGVRIESYFIRRIEDPTGRVVYNNEKPARHMVMTKNIAADMTSMMLDSYSGYGTGYGAGPDWGQIAGKTGSTEVSEGNMNTRDKWMVGYTPDFTLVTWVGLDEEGEISLDDLMPSGMGALFNIQTTNLMSISEQTPFNVTYASQMTDTTNHLPMTNWSDDWQEKFSENWIAVQEKAGEVWQATKDVTRDFMEDASQWLDTVDLPF